MKMYDYMFDWLRTATKEERHCEEMEAFAKKHPVLFMKFHTKSKNIIHDEIDSEKYLKAKQEITELFSKNEEAFCDVFEAVKKMVK